MAASATSMRDFRVMQMLGKGSFGSVYKCKRKADGQTYAVKEVNIRKLAPREREDAVNEIRILASIYHTNIVRYCEAFVERDNLYIVMEFAEHGDVHRQIKKFKEANKYIKEATIWSYLIQCCKALHELHSRRILHRDIKPKNIFLTGKNHVRLGDLGCAKLIKGGMARTQIGTPYYMSPEIWASRPYDTKSDMWAIGCFVYELCALHPPFLANDIQGLAHKIKTQPAPRISRHYSDDLAMVVARLLSKSPSSRPSIDAIIGMPEVQKRMNLLPDGDDGGRWRDDRQSKLLATIKVPAMLGRGMRCRLDLPEAAYPDDSSEAAPRPVSRGNSSDGGGGSRSSRSSKDTTEASRLPSRPRPTQQPQVDVPRPRLISHSREPSAAPTVPTGAKDAAGALAEAKARGYRQGGLGIAKGGRRAALGREPLREKSNAALPQPSRLAREKSHAAIRSEAAARRPTGAVRRYVSAAQAISRVPAPPVARRRAPVGFGRYDRPF